MAFAAKRQGIYRWKIRFLNNYNMYENDNNYEYCNIATHGKFGLKLRIRRKLVILNSENKDDKTC